MRHFKLPLLVTAVTLLVAILAGVIIVTSIHRSADSVRRKHERAQTAGGAVAVATCLVIAPFWLVAAARVGRERRARQASRPAGRPHR